MDFGFGEGCVPVIWVTKEELRKMIEEKEYACDECLDWFSCPSLGHIESCPKMMKDRAEALLGKTIQICDNPRCRHYLVGKDKRCPNQMCDKYDEPRI